MLTTTNAALGNQVPANTADSHPTSPQNYDISPRARKIVYLFLLGAVMFLGILATYVWYGFNQWARIP